MKTNKEKIDLVINTIKNNKELKENIIIKGGVSISLYLNFNRNTKDIDTFFIDDEIISSLKKKLLEKNEILKIDEINNKTKKLVLVFNDESKIEITFKKYIYKDNYDGFDYIIIDNKNGLKIFNPKISILDKIDRISRLWKNQWKNNPYEEFKNFIIGNYQRDLFDIYLLKKEIKEMSFKDAEEIFNKLKLLNNVNSKNYKFNNFNEMIEYFKECILYIKKNEKIRERSYYLKNVKNLITKSNLFKENFNNDDYENIIDYLSKIFE